MNFRQYIVTYYHFTTREVVTFDSFEPFARLIDAIRNRSDEYELICVHSRILWK